MKALFMCISEQYEDMNETAQNNFNEDDGVNAAWYCMGQGVDFVMVEFQNMVAFAMEMIAYVMRNELGMAIPFLAAYFDDNI